MTRKTILPTERLLADVLGTQGPIPAPAAGSYYWGAALFDAVFGGLTGQTAAAPWFSAGSGATGGAVGTGDHAWTNFLADMVTGGCSKGLSILHFGMQVYNGSWQNFSSTTVFGGATGFIDQLCNYCYSRGSFPLITLTTQTNETTYNPGGGALPISTWFYNVPLTADLVSKGATTPGAGLYHGQTFYAYFVQMAKDIKAYGKPVILRFDQEMTTGTFPNWCEGGASPTQAAGTYKLLYRAVHDIFTAQGVTNVTWLWCPNVEIANAVPMSQCDPGPGYYSLKGLDGYNPNNTAQTNLWNSWTFIYRANTGRPVGRQDSIAEVAACGSGSEPILIVEWGCQDQCAFLNSDQGAHAASFPSGTPVTLTCNANSLTQGHAYVIDYGAEQETVTFTTVTGSSGAYAVTFTPGTTHNHVPAGSTYCQVGILYDTNDATYGSTFATALVLDKGTGKAAWVADAVTQIATPSNGLIGGLYFNKTSPANPPHFYPLEVVTSPPESAGSTSVVTAFASGIQSNNYLSNTFATLSTTTAASTRALAGTRALVERTLA